MRQVLIALTAVLFVLFLATHAQALACTPPQHEKAGKCTDPAWDNNNFAAVSITPQSGNPAVTFVGPSGSMNSATGAGGYISLQTFRADKLILRITADATKPDLWVVVREDDVFHSEINIYAHNNAEMVFIARGDWNGRGKWSINIVNWGATTVSWRTDIITLIELSCTDSSLFETHLYKQCLPKVCADGEHLMPGGACMQPETVVGNKIYLKESGSTPASKKFVGGNGGLYSLKFNEQFEYRFYSTHRAMKIEVKVAADENSEAPHLWLVVAEENRFADEFLTAAGGTKVYTSKRTQPGQWTIRLANWAPDGSEQIIRPGRIEVRLFCDGEPDFYSQFIDISSSPITACMPLVPADASTGACTSNRKDWNNQGCVHPTVDFSDFNQLEVELDGTSSETSKIYVGKTGLSKAIAPKQALVMELNVYSVKLTAQLVNPDGPTPSDLEVRVYSRTAEKYAHPSTGVGAISTGKTWSTSSSSTGPNWGVWKIAVVNWAQEPITVPFNWLKLTYHCTASPAFTDQGRGISACMAVPCPTGQRKFVGDGGAVECVSPRVVGTFEPTFSPGEASNVLTFAGEATTTLQPKTSIVYEFKKYRGEVLALQPLADAESPDIYMRGLIDGVVAEYPDEFKPDGEEHGNWDTSGMFEIFFDKNQYTIEVVNWGTTAQDFKGANFVGKIWCWDEAASFQLGPGGVTSCFLRCPNGSVKVYHEVPECAAGSFLDAPPIPVTKDSPDAVTRRLTTQFAFSQFPPMTALSIIADNLRSSRLEVTIPPDFTTWEMNSGWYAYIFDGDTIVDQLYLSDAYTGATKQYTSTATGTNKGKWRVAFGFLHSEDPEVSAVWMPEGVTVKYSCNFGHFRSDGALETCFYSPCPNALQHRRSDDNCYSVNLQTTPTNLALTPLNAPAEQKKFIGTDTSVTIPAGQAVQLLHLNNLRADTLTLSIAQPDSPFIFVQVFENGKFVEEFFPTGEERIFTAEKVSNAGYGLWSVAIVNQGLAIEGSQDFVPTSMSVSLSCTDNAEFNGQAINSCTVTPATPPPPPPPPALYCAYTETVGFNPWERWNVFSLVGKLTLNGSSVEGRVAGAGDIDALHGATVHVQKEAFITKREDNSVGGPWSVTAGGTVTLDGATTNVRNGGIEASGTIEKTNGATFSSKQASTKAGVGDVLAAASEYFGGRSTTWGELTNSWIAYTPTTTELSVQLHGKVNVIEEVTVAAMAAVEKITLTGHPVGTLIVNVKGTDKLVLKPTLRVTYEGRSSSSGPEPPAFGRVLLNVLDAEEIGFGSGAATGPLHVSILAPQADAIFSADAPEVKGVVVVKSLKANNNFALQPFGTLARRLVAPTPVPPTPKSSTSSTGRTRTACLWHVL